MFLFVFQTEIFEQNTIFETVLDRIGDHSFAGASWTSDQDHGFFWRLVEIQIKTVRPRARQVALSQTEADCLLLHFSHDLACVRRAFDGHRAILASVE